jgi:DNA-directed RNA polymerase subunit beta'
MYRTQDLTGRGTIIPDPKLHIDQCKIPIEMSYQLYKPFIIKKLVQMGYSSVQAAQEVQEKSDVAEQVMREEMSQRPVLLNRAPTLHKYNIMAFKPIPVEGKSVFIPPLVIKGFGADFDGDSVSGDTWVLVEYEDGTEDLVQIRDVQ